LVDFFVEMNINATSARHRKGANATSARHRKGVKKACFLAFIIIWILCLIGGVVALATILGLNHNNHVYKGEFPPSNISYSELDEMECIDSHVVHWYVSNISNRCIINRTVVHSTDDFSLTNEYIQCYDGCYEEKDLVCGSFDDWIDYSKSTYSGAPWLRADPLQVVCVDYTSQYYICGYYWNSSIHNITELCDADYCQHTYLASKSCQENEVQSTNIFCGLGIGLIVVIGSIFTCIFVAMYKDMDKE
jgi:hypothetical protein